MKRLLITTAWLLKLVETTGMNPSTWDRRGADVVFLNPLITGEEIKSEEEKIMILGIHHFSIIVSSEESARFYQKLGFAEERRIERGYDTVVLMNGYGVGLEIFIDPKHPRRGELEPVGLRSISLRVDELEETAEELGLEDAEINTDWNGKRYCVITDPDGNPVQLCE